MVEPGGPILSERIGYLPRRQAASGHNPFQDEVREVRVRTDTGKILRIVTTDLDTPALEIAELYKRRWAIELYFRWIKQTLAIRKFVGVSENAIRSQVFIALSALLLMHMAHPSQTAAVSPLEFVRLARAHLMSPRDIADQMEKGGFKVDRHQVHISVAIKSIGLFTIPVVLHPEVKVNVIVNVARSEDEAERQARGENVLAEKTEAEEAKIAAEDLFEEGAAPSNEEASEEEPAEA